MNIQKQIDEIIQRGRERGKVPGCEVHHIVMRSLGGLDIPENLVPLLPREHYEIHKLYWQRNTDCYKSASAFIFMSDQQRIQTGEEYEAARKVIRKTLHERNGWIDNRLWHADYGIVSLSEEFNMNDLAREYTTNPSQSKGNISKVLCGKVAHAYTWRLADTGIYTEVIDRLSQPWQQVYLKKNNIIVSVFRSGNKEFASEYDTYTSTAPNIASYSQNTKDKWTRATQEEWEATSERIEFK